MALERVNWTKLMPIQRELISTRTREDWSENCTWIGVLK
jgi:hypothetical protein